MTGRAFLQTARLKLRPILASDRMALVAALDDFEIARWLYSVPHPYRDEDFRALLPTAMPGGTWAIEDAEGFAGTIGADGELGYWLARRAWGRGYATEAARAVLAARFADPAAGPLASGHFEGNDRSRRVLKRLGFVRSGHFIWHPVSRPDETALLCRMDLTRAAWLAADPLRIETARLVLAPLDPDRDGAALMRIGGDPRVASMLASVPSPWPEPDMRIWLARSQWRGHLGFRLGIFLDGRLVGSLGLFGPPAEIAYFVDPVFWGRGIATEALAGFLGWAVPRFGIGTVHADHFADNPASGRVLEKLGFSRSRTGQGRSRARPQPAPVVAWTLRLPSAPVPRFAILPAGAR